MTRVSLRTFPSPPPAPRPASGKELHPVARLPEEWRPFLVEHGEPAFRADQIYRWIHAQGVFDPERMSNLSRGLRARLGELGLKTELRVMGCTCLGPCESGINVLVVDDRHGATYYGRVDVKVGEAILREHVLAGEPGEELRRHRLPKENLLDLSRLEGEKAEES